MGSEDLWKGKGAWERVGRWFGNTANLVAVFAVVVIVLNVLLNVGDRLFLLLGFGGAHPHGFSSIRGCIEIQGDHVSAGRDSSTWIGEGERAEICTF